MSASAPGAVGAADKDTESPPSGSAQFSTRAWRRASGAGTPEEPTVHHSFPALRTMPLLELDFRREVAVGDTWGN